MLAPNVRVIEPTKKIVNGIDIMQMNTPKRVCAYCRVSTDSEEQQTSFESQKAFYTEYIQKHEGWIFAGIYADEGLSGTSMRKRKQFNQMIADAMDGKIDIIIVKSVSRFARNVVDILNIVEQLTLKGIPIIFENDHLNSMDDQAGTRMRLLMSAAVAEDFSQNLSDSVKWGKIRRIEQEKYPCVKTYGYRIKDHTYEIYEPEAQIIRLIYKSYLAGQSYCQICKMLMDREITSPGGVKIWKTSTVSYILENEKYKGDLLLQKQTYSDLKYRKRIKNTTGKQYYVENHHEPIISRADWNRVQREKEIRNNQRGYCPTGKAGYSSKYAFSNKLYCLACGSKFRRHNYDTVQKTVYTWVCINHKRYKNCKQNAIKEEDLERTFVALMKDIVADKNGFIETVISNIEEVVKNRQSENTTEEIDAKIIKIQNQMIGLVSNMTMTNTAEISAKTQEMIAEIERLKKVKETTIAEGLQLQVDLGRMDSLREIINTEAIFDKFNDGIFRRVVDKVLIDGKTATFVFCDAMRITRPIQQGTENE